MAQDKVNKLKDLRSSSERQKRTDQQLRTKLASSDLSALELALAVVRDDNCPVQLRLDAAKTVLPYTHRKMPLAIEGGDKPFVLEQTHLQSLSKAELLQLQTLFGRMGVAVAASETTH